MAEERLELRIEGRVQGVGFRWSTRNTAAGLGLSGWVRNEPDGSVSVLAEGPKAALLQLESWCRGGPRMSRVDRVQAVRSAPRGDLPRTFTSR